MANLYDRVSLDVAQLLAQQAAATVPSGPAGATTASVGSQRERLHTALIGLLSWARIYPRLVHSGLSLSWLHQFNRYWVDVLGNRRLAPHDFHWLQCHYRAAFQDLGVGDDGGTDTHLAAWQDARTVYLLFHYHYQLALNPLVARRYRQYIRPGSRVCEYGCGMAPIANSIVRHYPRWRVQVTCADIPHILLHYTRWRLGNQPGVTMVTIDPADDTPLTGTYDTIFCQTVLEHVPRPVAVVEHLHDRLAPGGYLIFDYILSEASGLDSAGGLRDRRAALEHVAALFTVVQGEFHLEDRSVGTVVVRKPGVPGQVGS